MAEGLFHDLWLDCRWSHHTGKKTQGKPEIPGQLCKIGRSNVVDYSTRSPSLKAFRKILCSAADWLSLFWYRVIEGVFTSRSVKAVYFNGNSIPLNGFPFLQKGLAKNIYTNHIIYVRLLTSSTVKDISSYRLLCFSVEGHLQRESAFRGFEVVLLCFEDYIFGLHLQLMEWKMPINRDFFGIN